MLHRGGGLRWNPHPLRLTFGGVTELVDVPKGAQHAGATALGFAGSNPAPTTHL